MNLLKKFLAFSLAGLLALSVLITPTSVSASVDENTKTTVTQNTGISIMKVDRNGEYELTGLQSFDFSFDMDGFLGIGTPHNAFNIVITPSGGSVIVKIVGDDGYSWTSSSISSNTTITTTNAKSGVDYTVTIKGAYAPGLHWGTYSATSYIK